ncbi:cellular retinoic acid-binding protein 2a [Etheostoma spectabile]|uniref:cellular retinoic acid-binding protein 2a n=1 Tax=Etheostoma spectabile TaxID=54343 RepID=UPI0013AF311C|nr:cellular retinoic acid-binding protein 2-like [Etheostoma spectabile]
MERSIPNFAGTWEMKSSENFEDLLKKLGVNVMLSFPRWESDSKISCEQTLQKGEGPKTCWTREITNDGKLILTMGADDVICTRVYERQ